MMSTNEKLFKFWVEQGWKVRLKNNPYIAENLQEYKTRLRHEYQVITSMQDYGFVDYFLMVSDLVRWAKNQGILVGPGRGSGAGSLICWLLAITEVDPMLYPMLFERFISIDRPDLPDLDIDFEDERRGEVIAYSQQKYGYDKVANILNFVRYKGKNSLDDVARVYHIPGWKIDSIKDKLVERSEGHARFADTLQDTFDSNPEIELLVEETPELKFATQLEGNYRNSSIHPAGIVISSVPLSNVCATYEKQSGTERGSGVAYDKKDGAYLGLLKVDFLSLTTLTGIRASLDAIGMSIAEYYRLTLDDPKVYEAFRQGDVLGIFQFEGHATKRVLKAVAPTKFMDLVDVNALSRPGGDDQAYVAAKNSGQPSWLSTVHENVARHVDWTHGTIVYQEQILLILRDLGNFPPADVNSVRKIISDKQDSTVFNEYLQRFVDGAATHGVSAADATRVWEGMVSATGYAFCVTGDTLVERCGAGGHPTGYEPTVSVRQLYEWQQTRNKTGPGGNAAYCMGHKIRRGDLRLLGMDDDGRIRPNQLERIHDPVSVRCKKITTESGRSLICSYDHRLLTSEGYKLALLLEVGDQVIMDMGSEAREKERILEHTVLRQTGYKKHDGSNSVKGEHNPSFIDGRTVLRDSTFQKVWVRDQAKCQHCGKLWDGSSHGLEFAHLMTLEFFEGDYRKYHDLKNIVLLCNSCHKKYDYQIQGTRQKRWSRGRPTGLESIVSIEEAGVQDVYDISMIGEPHNYLGNGFVNHNNISHAVCYSDTAYRQMWLKVYHPEFYLGQLMKCPSDKPGEDRRRKLIVEAMNRGIKVEPPNLNYSYEGWTLSKENNTLYAGFTAIKGVGPKMAANIVDWREAVGTDKAWLDWDDLLAVPGIGPGRVATMRNFAESDDPFGVNAVGRVLSNVRNAFRNGEFGGIDPPTHQAKDLSTPDEFVVFVGVLKGKIYRDTLEQKLKYGAAGVTAEEILALLPDPHLLKHVALVCEDETDEPIRVRIGRKLYPHYEEMVKSAKVDRDVVLVKGWVSDYGGIAIQAKEVYLINPEGL